MHMNNYATISSWEVAACSHTPAQQYGCRIPKCYNLVWSPRSMQAMNFAGALVLDQHVCPSRNVVVHYASFVSVWQ
jgi:hypothetical protein